MKKIITCFLLLLFCASGYAQKHERWDVKTVTDGFKPNFKSKQKVTVNKMHERTKIPVKSAQPRLNFEKKLATITGTVVRIKLESGIDGDNDYHIEIADGTLDDSTVVCEAVDPEDSSAATSPMLSRFEKVRKLAKQLKLGDKVTFTGLLFQDKYHSPSQHRTRNFVEIHPILTAKRAK